MVGKSNNILRTTEKIGEEVGESARNIQRYIRLTYLIPELLNMVDNNKIAFRPAVELSYLKNEEQYVLLDSIDCNEATPSLAQAIDMKKRSQEGKLTAEKIDEIMSVEKPNQIPKIKISEDRFVGLFPKDCETSKQREDFLYQCVLEHNKKIRNKEMER